MATIVDGVDFDTVAREWRCKWSADNDKQSLADAQKALNEVLAEVKAVDGFKKVDRVVCGGCLDFKVGGLLMFYQSDRLSQLTSTLQRCCVVKITLQVITSLPAGDKFAAWEASGFAPEETFLKKLESIDGISVIETQTYTIMPM